MCGHLFFIRSYSFLCGVTRMASFVEAALKERIARQGPLTFAQFMEMALYWPNGGYYAQPQQHPSDYFTAPAAHPAFGALLSLQLEEMWRLLDYPASFTVVEQGAGSGLLARDIIRYTHYLEPRFQQAVRYIAIDRFQGAPMSGDPSYEWIQSAGLPVKGDIDGCLLSNELLDALPVHRVALRKGRLQEIYVTLHDGAFIEAIDEPSTPLLGAWLEEEGVALAEGQRAEICLALEPWMQDVSACLKRGFLLTIDYGHTAQALYAPERFQGSLRCYYQHTLAGNPYVRVGAQDITAHVDFTAVMALGESHGLASHGLYAQAVFLKNLGLGAFQRGLAASELGQRERDANRMAMLELARPGGMGDFKALIQSKGVTEPRITGPEGPLPAWTERLQKLPLPLLDNEHLRLMEARYPHTGWRWEG